MKLPLPAARYAPLRGAAWVVLALALAGVPRASAQSRELFDDPLLRGGLDPFAKVRSMRTQPADGKVESLRFPDDNLPWRKFLSQYGLEHEMSYLADWEKTVRLPEFPPNTSERTRAELDYLLDLQSKRTESHRKAITREVGNGLDSFGWMLNERFNLGKMPATTRLFAKAMQDVLAVTLVLKKKYLRPSPSDLEPRLKPCIEAPPYPPYPSGHSSQMHVLAFITADLLSDGRADFEAEAFRVAWDREMAGLQYPSDTAAGQRLALQLMDILQDNPSYQADFKAAKAEWGGIKLKL